MRDMAQIKSNTPFDFLACNCFQTLVDMDGQTRLVGQGEERKRKDRKHQCSHIAIAILLDRISRVAFPFLFASFCSSYWTYYACFAETSLSASGFVNETEDVF